MLDKRLKMLPIGIQSFDKIRRENMLYVDKTARLQELTDTGSCYFLSRPRRFGKSLTISTLDAMFSGRAELFCGLAAEPWVTEQAKHPCPVLRLDMSVTNTESTENLRESIARRLAFCADDHGVKLSSKLYSDQFDELIRALYKSGGPVAVLIDEYDKPILDCIGDIEKADEMRKIMRTFYTVIKSCDDKLRFVMLTGISKFSKVGVFSAINNLKDISMMRRFGDIVGYTRGELEFYFADHLDAAADSLSLSRDELLARIKDYYDGFCFDGVTRLYNPFSMLNFLDEGRFGNYWYESGSPSFIIDYMKKYGITDPEKYSGVKVSRISLSAHEIERAKPESFLYQSGYLTIRSMDDDIMTLDYPNREVHESVLEMFLDDVFKIDCYFEKCAEIRKAVIGGDICSAAEIFGSVLPGLPYQDFTGRDEGFYRSLFVMLLRFVRITVVSEAQTYKGRSDIAVITDGRVIVIEFKFAKNAGEIGRLKAEGLRQTEEKAYSKPFDDGSREVISAVIVIDGEDKSAYCECTGRGGVDVGQKA